MVHNHIMVTKHATTQARSHIVASFNKVARGRPGLAVIETVSLLVSPCVVVDFVGYLAVSSVLL